MELKQGARAGRGNRISVTPLCVGLMQAMAGSGEGTECCTDLIGVPVSRERQREGMGVTPA